MSSSKFVKVASSSSEVDSHTMARPSSLSSAPAQANMEMVVCADPISVHYPNTDIRTGKITLGRRLEMIIQLILGKEGSDLEPATVVDEVPAELQKNHIYDEDACTKLIEDVKREREEKGLPSSPQDKNETFEWRTIGWSVSQKTRANSGQRDTYYHRRNLKNLRSIKEVITYILYEERPKRDTKVKREVVESVESSSQQVSRRKRRATKIKDEEDNTIQRLIEDFDHWYSEFGSSSRPVTSLEEVKDKNKGSTSEVVPDDTETQAMIDELYSE